MVAGGQDTIIEVRQPGKQPEDNADALLLGHAHNVCALDVSEDGTGIVSGSWDTEARVWQVGRWDSPAAVLQGHTAAVWAVSFYDKETIITGRSNSDFPAWIQSCYPPHVRVQPWHITLQRSESGLSIQHRYR